MRSTNELALGKSRRIDLPQTAGHLVLSKKPATNERDLNTLDEIV